MAWNDAWKQGWENMWGQQGGFFTPNEQMTQNQYYSQHFNDMALTEEGMLDVEGYMSDGKFDMKKLISALNSNDKEVASKAMTELQLAQMGYEDHASKEGGFAQVMNNPAFVMGLQMMKAAGEGKQIGEALAPSLTATQAFMTNQELRKQNKKLARSKEGNLIEQTLDYRRTFADTQTAEAQAQITGLTADNWAEEIRLKLEKAGLDIELTKLEKYYTFTTMGDRIKQTELGTKAMAQDLAVGDLKIEEMNIMLETLPEMNRADLAIKVQQAENMDVQRKGMILDNINRNIDNQVDALELKIMQNEEGINAEWRSWVNDQGYDAATKMAMLKQGPDAYFEMVDRTDINKHRDAYEAYSSSMGSSVLKSIFSSSEALDSDKTLIKEQIISLAVKNAKGGTPTKAHFEAAEEIVFKDWNIRKNSYVKRLLGFPEYKMGVFTDNPNRAMGGPVQAGQPYTVGEHGPETFVPKQDGNIVSNPRTKGGYTWEDAIIDSSEMLTKIKNASGIEEAKRALRKFRPDLYV